MKSSSFAQRVQVVSQRLMFVSHKKKSKAFGKQKPQMLGTGLSGVGTCRA